MARKPRTTPPKPAKTANSGSTRKRAPRKRASPKAGGGGFGLLRRLLRPLARPALRWGLRLGVVLFLGVAGLTGWLDFKVRAEFEGKRWSVPARVYARPLTLYPDKAITQAELLSELDAAGYERVRKPVRPGQFSASTSRVDVHTRGFKFWDGPEPERQISVSLRSGAVGRLTVQGKKLPIMRIEPSLLTRIYPNHHEDRVIKRLDELPPRLVAGLVVVEDRHFFSHIGISPRGVARAMFANVMAGGTVQGGSTLTQQLAKNFFLTSDRTLWRKFREALIALILEARYSKEVILAAYMNEIYLGQQGRTAIHGFGSAAWMYFGRPVNELALHESALLIALARGASHYNPRRHPERVLKRRNLVLELMAERGVIKAADAKRASALGLGLVPGGPPSVNPHPAFVELVRKQLKRDYREEDLRTEGLRIFTTLEPSTQRSAETVLTERLNSLEKTRKLPRGRLEGAVVVVEPASGQVLAVVGGRDPRAHGFNRALHARRPIGSLVKPAVYLAAFESGHQLNSRIDDVAVAVKLPTGKTWRPSNYDGKQNGEVALGEALERSLNLATVRLGMSLGLSRVAAKLRELGVERKINPVPSLLLGTLELTPLEVAGLYQPLAASGFQVPLRAIREVTDSAGKPLGRYPLTTRQAADPAAVAAVREAMVGVVKHGTAKYAGRTLPAHIRVAGKTGTTDDLRDSWFAGFGADRLAVVWIGRDDNKPARLTGASGALRVWTDLMLVAPPASLPGSSAPVQRVADGTRVEADASGAALASNLPVGGEAGGCEGDLLGGFIDKLLGSGCRPNANASIAPEPSEGGDQ
jgi:penicillin-binding protein 1B